MAEAEVSTAGCAIIWILKSLRFLLCCCFFFLFFFQVIIRNKITYIPTSSEQEEFNLRSARDNQIAFLDQIEIILWIDLAYISDPLHRRRRRRHRYSHWYAISVRPMVLSGLLCCCKYNLEFLLITFNHITEECPDWIAAGGGGGCTVCLVKSRVPTA